MKRRTIFRTAVIFGLLCILLPVAAGRCRAAAYSDIEGHWAQDVVERWSDYGILNGYPDGTFRPNAPVTRGQMAEILYRIWGIPPVEEGFSFPDLPEDSWCYDSLTTLNYYEVALTPDQYIRPNQALPRDEALYMIHTALRFEGTIYAASRDESKFQTYADRNEVTEFFREAVSDMVSLGIIQGKTDGKLHPKDPITRAEILAVMDRAFDHYITKPGTYHVSAAQWVLVTCPDVKIVIDDVASKSQYRSTVIFLNNQSAAGITVSSEGCDAYPASVRIASVSMEKPVATAEGNCKVSPISGSTINWVLSTYAAVPDLRFTGGYGSRDYPYLISNQEQFRLLLDYDNDYRNCFKLVEDLTFDNLTVPLDMKSEKFPKVNLDGGGHTITYTQKNDNCADPVGGLFLGWKGYCKNLTLKGTVDLTIGDAAAKKTANSTVRVGGFAAYMQGSLNNCTTELDITVRQKGSAPVTVQVGGLISEDNPCTLTNCLAAGTVRVLADNPACTVAAGGLVGASTSVPFGTIVLAPSMINCGAEGVVTVEGGNHTTAGGLIGIMAYPSDQGPLDLKENTDAVTGCWSTAEISASGAGFQSDCGGIVGNLSAGQVRSSWAKPTITIDGSAMSNIGGIAGACYEKCRILDCWTNASNLAVGSGRRTGGIAGRLAGEIGNCYTVGTEQLGSDNALAFAQWNTGTVNNCAALTNMTKDQAKAFFQACGWDMETVWQLDGDRAILRDCDAEAQRAAW